MRSFIGLMVTIAALAALPAQGMVVDGDLSDWGIDTTTLQPGSGIHYTLEDWTGTPSNGYLNPGYGGQAYDAEALYATFYGGRLWIALITGHDPNTLHKPSANSYGAGDFAIDFGKDGSFELGININHRTGTSSYESLVSGGVYKNPSWRYGLWSASGSYNPSNPDLAHPTSIDSSHAGSLLGTADLAHTTAPVTGFGSNSAHKHYLYELSLPMSWLSASGWDGSPFNIHWTMLCANDSILVDPPAYVPEPAALALFATALLGMAMILRRGRMAQQA